MESRLEHNPRSAAADAEPWVSDSGTLRAQLDRLRTELVDLAFSLERRARFDAADVAISVSARISELCEQNAQAKRGAGAEKGRKSIPPRKRD